MYKQRIINLTVSLFFGMLLVVPTVNAAPSPVKSADSIRLTKEELLCRQIQDKIKNQQEIQKFIKTSIQMGYDACATIKCAIKGGGELKQVITGAIDAGATKDVVSRCSIDAGADAKDVAAILSSVSEPGLCYVLPEEPEIIDPPPGGSTGGFLSPSGF
jgi:hypothetical protein